MVAEKTTQTRSTVGSGVVACLKTEKERERIVCTAVCHKYRARTMRQCALAFLVCGCVRSVAAERSDALYRSRLFSVRA